MRASRRIASILTCAAPAPWRSTRPFPIATLSRRLQSTSASNVTSPNPAVAASPSSQPSPQPPSTLDGEQPTPHLNGDAAKPIDTPVGVGDTAAVASSNLGPADSTQGEKQSIVFPTAAPVEGQNVTGNEGDTVTRTDGEQKEQQPLFFNRLKVALPHEFDMEASNDGSSVVSPKKKKRKRPRGNRGGRNRRKNKVPQIGLDGVENPGEIQTVIEESQYPSIAVEAARSRDLANWKEGEFQLRNLPTTETELDIRTGWTAEDVSYEALIKTVLALNPDQVLNLLSVRKVKKLRDLYMHNLIKTGLEHRYIGYYKSGDLFTLNKFSRRLIALRISPKILTCYKVDPATKVITFNPEKARDLFGFGTYGTVPTKLEHPRPKYILPPPDEVDKDAAKTLQEVAQAQSRMYETGVEYNETNLLGQEDQALARRNQVAWEDEMKWRNADMTSSPPRPWVRTKMLERLRHEYDTQFPKARSYLEVSGDIETGPPRESRHRKPKLTEAEVTELPNSAQDNQVKGVKTPQKINPQDEGTTTPDQGTSYFLDQETEWYDDEAVSTSENAEQKGESTTDQPTPSPNLNVSSTEALADDIIPSSPQPPTPQIVLDDGYEYLRSSTTASNDATLPTNSTKSTE